MQILKNIIELEQEVAHQKKQLSIDTINMSFGELINLYKNKELIIRPEHQHFFRWTIKQKTALIESMLLSITLPPIFVAEDENGIWELIDGLQIVTTFLSFFGALDADLSNIESKWALEAGGLLKHLKGFNVDTLPQKYKIILKRTPCRVEILRSESDNEMKHELFNRYYDWNYSK
jgi:uncharacterized protein with ParB-like and HNH nuclease domain